MTTHRVRAQRLELLPLAPEAAAALADSRATAAQMIGAKLPAEWPQPDLLGVLPRQAALAPDQARFGIWVVVEQESGSVVGDVGFFGPPDATRTVEMGYCIVPSRRGRGYATEAAGAVLAWVREQPEVEAVVARCDPENEPSIRTLERLGFSRTGPTGDGHLGWRLPAS